MDRPLTMRAIDRQIERLRAELEVVESLRRQLSVDLDARANCRTGTPAQIDAAATVLDKLGSWAAILENQLDRLLSVHLVPTPGGPERDGRSNAPTLRVVPSGRERPGAAGS